MDDYFSIHEEPRGKSFYFFDIDDNLLFLPTKIVLTNTRTGETNGVSTGQYADLPCQSWQDRHGMGRLGRQERIREFQRPARLLADVRRIFAEDPSDWQGPSWSYFAHACPTARGSHLKAAMFPAHQKQHMRRPWFVPPVADQKG